MRKSKPDGLGDYYHPDSPDNAIDSHFRTTFLDAIRRDLPQVLKALRADVFPVYWGIVKDGIPVHVLSKYLHRHTDLKTALDHWANGYHLHAPWMIDKALFTLHYWKNDHQREAMKWAPTWSIRQNLLTEAEAAMVEFVPLIKQAWAPEEETLDSYLKKLDAMYLKAKSGYSKRIIAICQEKGLRVTHKQDDGQHFVWLVRFQCGEEPLESLAKKYGKDKTALWRGIQSAAKLIDLPLRPRLPRRDSRTSVRARRD